MISLPNPEQCPECHSLRTKVLESFRPNDVPIRQGKRNWRQRFSLAGCRTRRHQCKDCKERWLTYETRLDPRRIQVREPA